MTWLAAMVREPIESVWGRLHSPVSSTKVDGEQIVALDLSVLGTAMRAVAGPQRRLSLPVAGLDGVTELDCSGLDLDTLDVRALPNLRVLRCSNNRLRELDLSQCPKLEVLECQGNALMLLDLRTNARLREVDCSGNGLGALVLPDDAASGAPSLARLDCSRNQLMVLELGQQPELVELRCFRNALVRLELGSAPKLQRLDCSRNDLPRLSLKGASGLAVLHAGRNRLDALDLSSLAALREVRCQGNYIGELDLGACRELELLDASDNQLEQLELREHHERLAELWLTDNRLESLRLPSLPGLEILRVSRNPLKELRLKGCPALRALDVGETELTQLDLSPVPLLIELRCQGTRLRALDLRANGELARVELDVGSRPRLELTEAQTQRLVSLRPSKRGDREIAELDPWELHELAWRGLAWRGVPAARSFGGLEDIDQLHQIARAPQVDLGTLRMMYWASAPLRYLRYRSRGEVPVYQQPGWDLLMAIEERVKARTYAQALISFDPRKDRLTRSVRGVDWTIERPGEAAEARREIPEGLR